MPTPTVDLTVPASLRAFIGADVATPEQIFALSVFHKRHVKGAAGWDLRGGSEGREWSAAKMAALSLDPTAVHTPAPVGSEEDVASMGAVPYAKHPVDDGPWDADAAIKGLRKWAGVDVENPSATAWKKYAEGFAYVSGKGDKFGDYHLPHHLIKDGKLYTSKRGVAAAIAAMHGGRGGVTSVPEADRAAVLRHLEQHRREWADEDKRESRARADATLVKAWEIASTKFSATDMPEPGDRDADGYYSRTWVQIAKVGKYKGHSAGPFEFNSDVFDKMVANHEANENGIVPFDFEHSSEAQDSSVFQDGAPAVGWILSLENRGDEGLFAMVGWVSLKCIEYIRGHQYKFCSPAVLFDATDAVSGKNIGPVLVSAACTNRPFLVGMRPIAARAREAMAANALAALGNTSDATLSDADVLRIATAVHALSTPAAVAASETARPSEPHTEAPKGSPMSNITQEQHEELLKAHTALKAEHEKLKGEHSSHLMAHKEFCAKCAEKLGLSNGASEGEILKSLDEHKAAMKKFSDDAEMRAKAEADSDADKAAEGMRSSAAEKAALRELRMLNPKLFSTLYGKYLVAPTAPTAPHPASDVYSPHFDGNQYALTHQMAAPGGANPGAIPLADTRKKASEDNGKLAEAAFALMKANPNLYDNDFAKALKVVAAQQGQ